MSCRLPEIETLITQWNYSKEDVLCGLAGAEDSSGGSNTTRNLLGSDTGPKAAGDTTGRGLAVGEDLLDLEGHFRSWWEHGNRQYEIMFARYETLVRMQWRVLARVGALAHMSISVCGWVGA